jgi:Zn-dependent protease
MVIFGFPMSVHWSFWLVMVFLGGGQYAQSPAEWLQVGLFVIAGTVSIGWHELGHALVGRRFGARGISIQFYAMGGLCSFQQASFSRLQSFLMTFAGPLAGYLLGIMALLASSRLSNPPEMIAYLLADFVWVNFVWSTLNLLPIFPLDGGQMLSAALGPRRLRLTLKIAVVTAAILAVLVLTYSPHQVFILIFLAYSIWENVKVLRSM